MTKTFSLACGSVICGLPLIAISPVLAASSPHQQTVIHLAANEADLPLSKDELFGDLPDAGKPNQAEPRNNLPDSKDALFGADSAAGIPDKEPGPAFLPDTKETLFGTMPDESKPDSAEIKAVLPESKDALFGSDIDTTSPGKTTDPAPLPDSKETLFGAAAGLPVAKQTQPSKPSASARGYIQTEIARTYADPDHWSKAMGRLEVGTQGRLGQGKQWKISGRIDYNAVYDLTDFYQSQVQNDQRAEFNLRETYLDFSSGDWDWRLGRQHIVWGEMVGLFFADVVSAKDLREFVLPDFQVLRIPQWAARSEYFKDDFHAEVIWIPLPSYDNIGKPTDFSKPGSGADFYPYPPSIVPMTIQAEDKPNASLSHGNFGVRITQLTKGWDLSAFYYTSMNSYPTWYRDPVVKTTFSPRHDRIWQFGGTLGKDLGDFVLKAEAVYTNGRRLNLVTNLLDSDGVVKQNTLDWAVGLDFNPGLETRVNTQLYQSYTFRHDTDTIPDKSETGVSLLVNHKLPNNWQAEILLVHSLNRSDWMARPKAIWEFQPNWKMSVGLDMFGGPVDGLFGQYDQQDRAYVEIRHDF